MKILHLSTSDIEGGAARAAYRLHQGLKATDVDSQMLVRAKSSIDRAVIQEQTKLTKLGPSLNGLPLRFYPHRQSGLFSPQWFPDAIAPKVKQLDPDIIHLHWIYNGYLQIETLTKFNKPIVWTTHDMGAFTGGCHYTGKCDQYTNSCGACPQLKSNKVGDLSRWVWNRKAKAWKDLNLTVVCASSWMAECARASSLFKNLRVEVIPYGLDLEKYKPIEQKLARKLLDLPQDKQLVLFGTSPGIIGDPRKGFQLLQPALQNLNQFGWQEKLELVVFGASQPENPINLGFRTHYLGQFQDDISLALVYSSADVMVVPSIQEAYGQTASESLACGTPVVAFAATGPKDIIDHQYNGYLANPFEIEDFAKGIAWILENNCNQKLRIAAREKAEREFALDLQADRYLSVYQELLTRNNHS